MPSMLLLLLLLLAQGWCSRSPVPAFLKHMADQAEGHEVALAASGSWHPMARSVAPLRVIAGPDALTLNFLVPNDDWSVAGRRQCLLVLSPRPSAAPGGGGGLTVAVRSAHAASWRLSQSLSAEKQFLQFNLTQYVDPRHQRQRHLSLEVSAWDDQGRSLAAGDAIIVGGVEFGPLLVLTEHRETVSPIAAPRPRRTILDTYSPHALPGCRLEPWAVSAIKLGWKDVVYPQHLRLNLCVGQCPPPVMHDSLKPSNHAVARNLFKALNLHDSARHPDIQCVPIRFRSASMVLELAEGNYTVSVSEDLSAIDCGCR